MGMTRATFLIVAAMVVALAVAAAGIGAYIAVRQNATAPTAEVAHSERETGLAAAIHGMDPQTIAGEPRSEPGVAVESTEQAVEPTVAPGAQQPVADTSRTRPVPEAPSRQDPAPEPAETRPTTPAPRPAAPPRPQPSRPESATDQVERPAPPPVSAAAAPEPQSQRDAPTKRNPPAQANSELPEIDGWRPADPVPSTAIRDAAARRETGTPELPPLASASSDPPNRRGRAEPVPPATEALLIPADSVIGLQIDTFVTTDSAEVEDDVTARVTRDVMVARRVAIPAGSIVNGSVVMVERGGKLKGTARLGVRFHTVVLDDGVEVPIVTETVYREGRSRGRDNAARIGGGAVAGAILGAIFGGGRGAAIGGAAGAAGGTAAAAAGDAEAATLPTGTTLTVRLSRPGSVTVER